MQPHPSSRPQQCTACQTLWPYAHFEQRVNGKPDVSLDPSPTIWDLANHALSRLLVLRLSRCNGTLLDVLNNRNAV